MCEWDSVRRFLVLPGDAAAAPVDANDEEDPGEEEADGPTAGVHPTPAVPTGSQVAIASDVENVGVVPVHSFPSPPRRSTESRISTSRRPLAAPPPAASSREPARTSSSVSACSGCGCFLFLVCFLRGPKGCDRADGPAELYLLSCGVLATVRAIVMIVVEFCGVERMNPNWGSMTIATVLF
jgi:hypothetical protein